MKPLRAMTLLTLAAFALISFQNCDPTDFKVASLESAPQSSSTTTDSGNGQPYDGKPFIIEALCPDGTQVRSRLVMTSASSGTLYRENCSTITPVSLTGADVTPDPKDPNKLIYKGVSYEIEKPAIPLPGMISWYYQLTGTLQPRPASIYIIDMFDNDANQIASLKASGHTVICSVAAGIVETWRPDANRFLASDIGNQVGGSSSEKWIDTRSANVRSIMLSRLDLARSKGCHGVDFDNVDGFSNNTGFSLSATTQLDYNQFLAFAAHDRKLILSLNNVPELAGELANVFDFAIAEQCFQYGECDSYLPFIEKSKPVLAIEYTPYSSLQCDVARVEKISLAFFDRALDGTGYMSCQ